MPEPQQQETMTQSFGRLALSLLEKQGLAVVLVGVGVLWASGWLPFKVCEPQVSQSGIISVMEQDRKQMADAIKGIALAVQRMDSRDAIRTCAAIVDKDARVSCIQVAVTGLGK